VVTTTLDIVQWYCFLCGFIVVIATVDTEHCYCLRSKFIVFTATVDIVKCYCVLCGVYCGYSNSRYSEMLLCFVWSLLWLQQQ